MVGAAATVVVVVAPGSFLGQKAQTPIPRPTTINTAISRRVTSPANLRQDPPQVKGVVRVRENCDSQSCTVVGMEVRMEEMETERHVFRTLFKIALFVGFLVVIARLIAAKKDEFYGISESEARYKVESRLSPRVGDDRAAEIADQVVARLKQAGVVTEDSAAGEAAAAAKDAANEVVDAAQNAADAAKDKAEDAMDSVMDEVEDITTD